MNPATAIAQAAEALRGSGREHKRLSAAHRKAAREDMQRAALLEHLAQIGITVVQHEGDTDGT